MTTPTTPTDPRSAGDEPKLVGQSQPAPSSDIDEQLHEFWKKNGRPLAVVCGLVLLFYVAKSGWEYFANQKEVGVQEEYAAATTSDKLQGFVTDHPDHPLAGLAELQLADQYYASGNLAGAVTAYGQAVFMLKSGPLYARAQLGLAMSKVQSGQTVEGESALHQLADDTNQFLAVRAEATYQLASLAASAGRADEVQKLSVQLLQMDPNSQWAQRAFGLMVAKTAPAVTPPVAPAHAGVPFK